MDSKHHSDRPLGIPGLSRVPASLLAVATLPTHTSGGCICTPNKITRCPPCLRVPSQDAVDQGWLRQGRSFVDSPINISAVLATAAEVASGMAYLHRAGVVHGDLSPYNVLLSRWVGGGGAAVREV